MAKVVAMRARQNLFKMLKVVVHSHNMILNVTKVHSDVESGGDLIVWVATLGESPKNIRLAIQKPAEAHCLLPKLTKLLKEVAHVFGPGNENLIFDLIDIILELLNNGSKRVDNVVTEGMLRNWKRRLWQSKGLHESVADPIGTQGYVVLEHGNALADM